VFIDPPYNTGSAFTHYDDVLEHSIWLGLMRDRLEIIKRLLADDGSLWITIDDNEAHYLKFMCDEVLGRANFVANVIWQKFYSQRMDAKLFRNDHDNVLVYRKSEKFIAKQLFIEQNLKQFSSFKIEILLSLYKKMENGKFTSKNLLKKPQSSIFNCLAK
jgi:adenine-specific DNA-methyltransferase